MAKIQNVRGTYDLYGEAKRKAKKVISTGGEIVEKYGFEEIETPIFEFTEVFSRNLGDTSDIVTKEMYCFQDRGGESLTLRPEGTAGVVRSFISEGMQQNLPVKLYYAGPMFRYERPQKAANASLPSLVLNFWALKIRKRILKSFRWLTNLLKN